MSKAGDGLVEGSLLWIPENQGKFALGEVTHRQGSMVKVKVGIDRPFSIDLEDPDMALYKANHEVVADMTSLKHLHIPGILHNLRKRALEDQPYTFLGNNVLVAVNPLKHIADPPKALGTKMALNAPLPYALAEGAFQQLCFAATRKNMNEIVNQSILVSGESGSGKTESSKMVLKHLVYRCCGKNDLDKRLLNSTPILEAFGNAATKRNHNSSRFGKFLKLHFERNHKNDFAITKASVETYLLERSRVTAHGEDERAFHVYYMLLQGASKDQKRQYGLDQGGKGFNYTLAKTDNRVKSPRSRGRTTVKTNRHSLTRLSANDKKYFQNLCKALELIGINSKSSAITQDHLFRVVAAILHIGNVELVDDEANCSGNVSTILPAARKHLEKAAELLQVDADALSRLFMEKPITVVGRESIAKKLDSLSAKDARDAVAKTLYVYLFDWLVHKITESLGNGDGEKKHNHSQDHFIGVLDIFGFESFRVNDFEQLLINYANEALQLSFNEQIFAAEASLYEKEGLLVNEKEREKPLDNSACMELLSGYKKGVLGVINAELSAPQPLDEKMCAALHRTFKDHPNFVKPHPKDVRSNFIIRHFAGEVKYTVGHFLEKNSDKVPHQVDAFFLNSKSTLVATMFEFKKTQDGRNGGKQEQQARSARKTIRGMNSSIINRFKRQIDELVTTLNETRCSFIRCIKPNPHLLRESDDSWFDNIYVQNQLENLSIPQTCQVLRGGLPTRLPYDMFVGPYVKTLPKNAIRVWQSLGQGDERAFVKALFYAYKIDPSKYKMGLTKIFFQSGMLEELTSILEQATSSKTLDKSLVQRFRKSFARHLWRKAYVKVLAFNRFKRLLVYSRQKNGAITVLQRVARRRAAEAQGKAELAKLRETKRKQEELERKRAAKEARRKQKEAERKAEEARQKKERDAELLRLKEAKLAEEARQQEEKAKKATEETAKVRKYRQKMEKRAKQAQQTEKEETKRTIIACGGEEGYKKQIEREQSVSFNDKVSVAEFEKWLDVDDHIIPLDDRYAANQDDFVNPDNLEDLAGKVKVVFKNPDEEAKKRKSGRKSSKNPLYNGRKSMQQKKAQAEEEEEEEEPRRRSYAPPVPRPKNDGFNHLVCDDVEFALEENEVPSGGDDADGSDPNVYKKRPTKTNTLACLLMSKKPSSRGRKNGQKPGSGPSSDRYYNWQSCFLTLTGFQIRYFKDWFVNKKTGEMHGEHLEGTFGIPSLKEALRFAKVSDDPKLDPKEDEPQCILKLIDGTKQGPNLVLRFGDKQTCNEWTSVIMKSRKDWKAEYKAMRKLEKGEFRKSAVMDYKRMLENKLMSKSEYKLTMFQQVSNDTEYLVQDVAMYGEDNVDKRMICPECREINFVVGDLVNGRFPCHNCQTDVLGNDPTASEESEEEDDDYGGTLGPPPSNVRSLLQPSEEARRSKARSSQFPITVILADKTTLTVYEGELLGRPRYDLQTQERKYLYSFRCQFEDVKSKTRNVQYWSVDLPYSSFELFELSLKEEFASQRPRIIIPELPAGDPKNCKTPQELARARLPILNKFMEELLKLAQREPMIFNSTPCRFFFNLRSVVIAPLVLEDLQRLKEPMDVLYLYTTQFPKGLPKGKTANRHVIDVYESIQAIYTRIEASADHEIVFNTTDQAIAQLSMQEKGRIFQLAREYMKILDDFANAFVRK